MLGCMGGAWGSCAWPKKPEFDGSPTGWTTFTGTCGERESGAQSCQSALAQPTPKMCMCPGKASTTRRGGSNRKEDTGQGTLKQKKLCFALPAQAVLGRKWRKEAGEVNHAELAPLASPCAKHMRVQPDPHGCNRSCCLRFATHVRVHEVLVILHRRLRLPRTARVRHWRCWRIASGATRRRRVPGVPWVLSRAWPAARGNKVREIAADAYSSAKGKVVGRTKGPRDTYTHARGREGGGGEEWECHPQL